MEFEDILQQTGGFGKFQRSFTILFIIPVFCVTPWIVFNKVFMLSVPQHWCHVPDLEYSNLSIVETRALISPPSDPSCSMYDANYTDMVLKGIFVVPNDSQIIPCMEGWNYDTENYDHTAATKWNMVCKYDYLPSLVLTLHNIGILIGTPIYGLLSDKFGRKIVFLYLAALIVVTEVASTLVDDFVVFSVIRIISGSAFPTTFSLPYILTMELVTPNMRGHINGIINTCWTLGFCFLPLLAYLSRNWITLCYIVAGSAMYILVNFRLIPESPSWLISREKIEDATAIMLKIAKENGKPQNKTEMSSLLQKLMEKGKKKKEGQSSSQCAILKYPRLRKNFLIISFCWVAFTVSYSGLTFNMINLSGNEFINFFLICIVEFPGNLIFWFAMDKFGRRWIATLGFFLTGLSCLLPLMGFSMCDILSSMLGKLLSAGAVMVTDQQAMELFPTETRSFSFGAGKTISAALTMFVPFIAYCNIYGKAVPFLIISSTCFLASALCTLLPESLDEYLPQTISDAESFGKDQKFLSWNRKKLTSETLQDDINNFTLQGKDEVFKHEL